MADSPDFLCMFSVCDGDNGDDGDDGDDSDGDVADAKILTPFQSDRSGTGSEPGAAQQCY